MKLETCDLLGLADCSADSGCGKFDLAIGGVDFGRVNESSIVAIRVASGLCDRAKRVVGALAR